MKLLPRSELNTRINAEKKATIDSGVFLAKKIDALREELLTLQKDRDIFISGSQKVINDSLRDLQQKQDSLSKEITGLEIQRKELLKPLDYKWKEVNEVQIKVLKEKEENRRDRERLNLDEEKIAKTKKEISQLVARTRYKEREIEEARTDALNCKEMGQREFAHNREKYTQQREELEKEISTVNQRKIEYENGVALYERKEKDLVEREQQLLTDRKHLESQQRTLRIAREATIQFK